MLKFRVFESGKPPANFPLRNAYLLGSNGNAIRSDIRYEDGLILCENRESGTTALAIQHPVGDCGELTIQTCLLPARDEPYQLTLELARHQLRLMYVKLEDWGMFDLGADAPVMKRLDTARSLFVEALCRQHDDPKASDKIAQECLIASVDGSEELALAHSRLMLSKRRSNGDRPKCTIGCGIDIRHTSDRIRSGLTSVFDYIYLPMSWRTLEPEENEYHWSALDSWIEWASRAHLAVVAGPIIRFEPQSLPHWLYIWEHDFDTVRDLIYEHVETVVKRYAKKISTWNIVSGLNVNNHFTFSFDQIMDLTRMTTALVKNQDDSAKTLVEICQPFGEYYGANVRSIPPLMYSDLLVQGSINFDGLSIRLMMGQATQGQYTRDLMQISHLLDQFSAIGKPLMLTASTPSQSLTQPEESSNGDSPPDVNSGFWHKPWSPQVQSHWLEALFQIALSKPYVDSVAWGDLVDHADLELPLAGIVDEDMQPKLAFRRLVAFRKGLLGNSDTQGRKNKQ